MLPLASRQVNTLCVGRYLNRASPELQQSTGVGSSLPTPVLCCSRLSLQGFIYETVHVVGTGTAFGFFHYLPY